MRILIVSDIHANLNALDAVFEDAGIFDAVWCLGDLVGYGPDPNECVERIREIPDLLCIGGNHDKAAIGDLPLDAFNGEAHHALEWTNKQLTAESISFLHDLPAELVHDPYTLAHGSPRRPLWEYLLDAPRVQSSFSFFTTRYCLVGHSHVAIAFQMNERNRCVTYLPSHSSAFVLGPQRMILNPGSVGQPRDQDPRAAYSIINTDTLEWEWHRVEYDVESVQSRMQSAKLPPRLILRLAEGW
jgi:diadenosine tetraphosphatase ApaH/serine/threonine PP2A family protein phosphatase